MTLSESRGSSALGDTDQHLPVLVDETLELLAPERGGLFVDATVGLGGHSRALLERGTSETRLLGLDRDPEALELAAARLGDFGDRVQLVRASFSDLDRVLADGGHPRPAGILADLGVSSLQLDRGERGFSFRRDGPLDMRMGPDLELDAHYVVNHYPEADLVRILEQYGEERRARRIARAIVEERQTAPIERTSELRDLVHRVSPPPRRHRHRGGGIDAATRTFQAIRIEVNRELAGLEELVEKSIAMLEEEGRLVVISYHSLEDRIVKHRFREAALGTTDPITGRPHAETRLIEVMTKRPVRPSEREVERNPRSRSARLRAALRI